MADWATMAPWKDLYDVNKLYNNTIKHLTSTVSMTDLNNKIIAAVNAQRAIDNAVRDSTKCEREARAFDAMNNAEPDFLELESADWKPTYGCQ